MTVLATTPDDDKDTTRQRRCIVTGEHLSDAELVRFVADPDGHVVPDVAAVLPGRGLWVTAERNILERAIAKNRFSKAAKQHLTVGADLIERTVAQLVRRMLADLGMARRAGRLDLGYDSVVRAFDGKIAPAVLIEAGDGAADGRRKVLAQARARGLELAIVDALDCAELSLALGRENVIHAALKPGRLAERLVMDAARLKGLRPGPGRMNSAGSHPARHERDE